jgi:uncharacterized protein (DUF1800 family)
MNEQFRVSQKIGLFFRPEDGIPSDIHSWAINQLKVKSEAIGIETIKGGNPNPKPWPSALQPNLAQRVAILRIKRANEDKYNEDKTLTKIEKDRLQSENHKKYNLKYKDELKFAHRNIYGEDQVRQRFTLFWVNHFTIGDKETTTGLIGHFIEEAIMANLNNSFDDMLYKVTSHPAMLTYLDNIYSDGENSKRARECRKKIDCQSGLNDNLGRELLELHTVSPKQGYTEKDIRSVAKVLAGWGTIVDKDDLEKNGLRNHLESYIKNRAEPGNKVVLGKTIYSGFGGLRQLTNYLASLDHTAEHLSTKLCHHFVSDTPTQVDINYVMKAWKQSKGDLNQIHTAVIDRAILSKEPKFQWPVTWLFHVIRLSGATFFRGWNDLHKNYNNDQRMHTGNIFEELGQSFWATRQPNGYSNHKVDWISGEFLERRLRFSEAIYNTGYPIVSPQEIMDRIGANDITRTLVQSVGGQKRQFIALMCSPELMGV